MRNRLRAHNLVQSKIRGREMAQQSAECLRFHSYLADGFATRGREGSAEVQIIDPWSGDAAAVLEFGGRGAVEAAVRAACEAYRQNSGQTRGQRAQWLEAAAGLIAENEAALTELSIRTIGKAFNI